MLEPAQYAVKYNGDFRKEKIGEIFTIYQIYNNSKKTFKRYEITSNNKQVLTTSLHQTFYKELKKVGK